MGSICKEGLLSPARHRPLRETTEGSWQVLSGTIDLVYKRPSDWTLLDYKTDGSTTADGLRARYQQQIDAYAEAWGSLAGGNVSAELISTRK